MKRRAKDEQKRNAKTKESDVGKEGLPLNGPDRPVQLTLAASSIFSLRAIIILNDGENDV